MKEQLDLPSQQLIQSVERANRRYKLFMVSAVVVALIGMTFIAIKSAATYTALRTTIDQYHQASKNQLTNQELLLETNKQQLTATEDLLRQQDVYLTCLVSLFVNNGAVTQDQFQTCVEPFKNTNVSTNASNTPSVSSNTPVIPLNQQSTASPQQTGSSNSAPANNTSTAPQSSSSSANSTTSSTPPSPNPVQPVPAPAPAPQPNPLPPALQPAGTVKQLLQIISNAVTGLGL